MNILVIDDDALLSKYVAGRLESLDHHVVVAGDGAEGLFLSAAQDWDLLIVDRMMPNLDGLSLVRTLRRRDPTTPVLFLSGMDTVEDRVQGLQAGADDYLTKPFEFTELKARVEALGRRRVAARQTKLKVGDLELDRIGRHVERAGRQITLQHREFQLLECLMRRVGVVLSRKELLELVWDLRIDPQTNIIETHISRLRSKVDQGFEHQLIHTIRGTGYCIRPPPA